MLAAEYPLRFLNLRGSWIICRVCLFFDACAVGHAGWTIYYLTRPCACKGEVEKAEDDDVAAFNTRRLESAELYHKTGSPYGGPNRITSSERYMSDKYGGV